MGCGGKFCRVIADTAKQTRGDFMDSGRWQEIQGAWVLQPSKRTPVAVVHFIGGVFVGATPQLTYRLFLERLCERYDSFGSLAALNLKPSSEEID
jgi:hypothetical protein